MDAVRPVTKPLGKKRALLIAIQHIQCKDTRPEFAMLHNLPNLPFAHRDAEELCSFLIAHHDYQKDDIIIMKDDRDHPRYLWPTHNNILNQIDRLIYGASEGCHFFFYYSGHGIEDEYHDRTSTKANGRGEEIVAADGKPILDHLLHDRLISPLQNVKDTKLFALFDCCHSETLLDLQKGSGPNFYNRVWKCGRDQTFKAIIKAICCLLALNKRHRREGRRPRRASTTWVSPPVAKTHEFEKLSVICLSACRDGQLAHDVGGQTFTKCFLEVAETRSKLTWTELRDAVKHEIVSKIQSKYEEISHEPCPQSPRYSTGSHTDLTKAMSL